MPLACTYCILTRGLKGSEITSLPTTEEELLDHYEREHHMPARREGETADEAMTRFSKAYPEAGGPNCKCPACTRRRALLSEFGL